MERQVGPGQGRRRAGRRRGRARGPRGGERRRPRPPELPHGAAEPRASTSSPRLRLNEHAFHTWDIEVVFDDGAHLPHDAAAVVVDNLGLIARFTGRPTGEVRDVVVRTTDPAREFTVRLSADAVELSAGESGREPDLVLPAEAFCRLVYGRLDPDHTPAVTGDEAVLDTLRAVFPGP